MAFKILFPIVELQNEKIENLSSENQMLRDENNLLKGEQTKPNIGVLKRTMTFLQNIKGIHFYSVKEKNIKKCYFLCQNCNIQAKNHYTWYSKFWIKFLNRIQMERNERKPLKNMDCNFRIDKIEIYQTETFKVDKSTLPRFVFKSYRSVVIRVSL